MTEQDPHEKCRAVAQQAIVTLAGAVIALAHLLMHPNTPRAEAMEATNRVLQAIYNLRNM